MHLSLNLDLSVGFQLVISIALLSAVVVALWRAIRSQAREGTAQKREEQGSEKKGEE
jgi:hypothetical protein